MIWFTMMVAALAAATLCGFLVYFRTRGACVEAVYGAYVSGFMSAAFFFAATLSLYPPQPYDGVLRLSGDEYQMIVVCRDKPDCDVRALARDFFDNRASAKGVEELRPAVGEPDSHQPTPEPAP